MPFDCGCQGRADRIAAELSEHPHRTAAAVLAGVAVLGTAAYVVALVRAERKFIRDVAGGPVQRP
jgi:hypothetical protein